MKRKIIFGICMMSIVASVMTGCNKKKNVSIDETDSTSKTTTTTSVTTLATTTSATTTSATSNSSGTTKPNNTTQATTSSSAQTALSNSYLDGGALGFVEEYKVDNIVYSGGEISFKVGTTTLDGQAGVLILANGIPQLHYTNEDPTKTYISRLMYTSEELQYDTVEVDGQKIQTERNKEFEIFFTPSVGKKGEEVDVLVLFVNGAWPKPTSTFPIMPFYLHYYMQNHIEMKMEVNAEESHNFAPEAAETVKFTKKELDELVYVNNRGELVDNLAEVGTGWDNKTIIAENGKFTYELNVHGGEARDYIVLLMWNNIPFKMYTATITDREHKAHINIEVEITEELKKVYNLDEYSFIYPLVIPVRGNNGKIETLNDNTGQYVYRGPIRNIQNK